MEVRGNHLSGPQEEHAMGEAQATLFPLDFNRSVRVEARAERLSADGGALLLRSLMDRVGLARLLERHLTDPRDPARITHPWLEIMRTHLLLLAQGWSDQADATLLRRDPVFRLAVSSRRGDGPLRPARGRAPEGLCSQPTLSRSLEDLASEENRAGLAAILLHMAERGLDGGERAEEIALDLDSLPVEVHGHQSGSAYNGHYGIRCFHPLVLRSSRGDFLAGRLRPGNVHTADGALAFALPALRMLKRLYAQVWLRVDAGFPEDTFLSALEEEGVRYAARIRTNATLERLAAPYLKRPPGRPPSEGRTWAYELRYRAGTWTRERRVVLVVLERADEQQHLFLDHFFLLTNAPPEEESGQALLARYRKRGTAEKDFGEWQNTLQLSLSSSARPKTHYRDRRVRGEYVPPDSFRANEARLLLSLIAANLLHAGAELLGRSVREAVSRARFRQLVLKAAARVTLSARGVTVVIEAARAKLWSGFWRELGRIYPARGSPPLQALPTPAA
jgi:hypothetical protein